MVGSIPHVQKAGHSGGEVSPNPGGCPGGSNSQSDVYLSTGQQSANMSGRLNPLSLATSPWHSMRAHSHLKKRTGIPRTPWLGGPKRYLLSQEHVNVVLGGGNPNTSPMRFPAVRSGHLRLKVRCRVQGL